MTEKKKGGPRILVLGSNGSGARDFSDTFQEYLDQTEAPAPRVDRVRDVAKIREAFFDEDDQGNRNLPKRVVLFREMRQYDPNLGGMTLDTEETGVTDDVQALCNEHDVPLVRIRRRGIKV